MNRIITIASNDVDESISTEQLLKEKLIEAGFLTSNTIEENTELLVCIGGDGSFLRTMHRFNFPNVPIIVINTGHLGFFAEVNPDQLDKFISEYKGGNYFIQDSNLIKANIFTKYFCTEITAINEVVIKNIASRTVHLDLEVNQTKMHRFSGDGMLISTPIGSTAYNYSAGGSLVDPSLELFQLTPIAPMNTKVYRSFTSSIILSINSIITIYPNHRFENSTLVVVDGEEFRFNELEKIDILKSETKLKLLRINGYEFWNRVSDKFL
ncbi:MAG: NAD(+)/NADH kinase [Peptostreptococcaceae bacterium]